MEKRSYQIFSSNIFQRLVFCIGKLYIGGCKFFSWEKNKLISKLIYINVDLRISFQNIFHMLACLSSL